jgi:hypothetical protein
LTILSLTTKSGFRAHPHRGVKVAATILSLTPRPELEMKLLLQEVALLRAENQV